MWPYRVLGFENEAVRTFKFDGKNASGKDCNAVPNAKFTDVTAPSVVCPLGTTLEQYSGIDRGLRCLPGQEVYRDVPVVCVCV